MKMSKFLPLAILLSFSLLTTSAFAMTEPENAEELNVSTSWVETVLPILDAVEFPSAEAGQSPVIDKNTLDYLAGVLSAMGGAEEAPALTPDGNMTLVDDISAFATGKEFLTVTTKNGNYFYLIVDRSNDGEGNVHFLNKVDEADLMALIESDEPDTPAACSCADKCFTGSVNTSCEICSVNMTGCAGKEPEPEPEPEPAPEEEPQKESMGVGVLPIILVVAAAGVGAVYFLKFRKNKKPSGNSGGDPDDYAFGGDDEEDDPEYGGLEDEDE